MPRDMGKDCIEARARAEGAKPLLIIGIILGAIPLALLILFPLFPVGIALLALVFLYYVGWIFGIASAIMIIVAIMLIVKERSACSM